MKTSISSFIIIFYLIFYGQVSFGQCNCDTLPAPGNNETIYFADSLQDVLDAIEVASGPSTIYLRPGTYHVSDTSFIYIDKNDITIRSTTGNRDDVVIHGMGMDEEGEAFGIFIEADNITIADLTVTQVQTNGILIESGSDNCLFHNIRSYDCGEQLFEAIGTTYKYNGIVQCSLFEYTGTNHKDDAHTSGIELNYCYDWIIRDNIIKNIKKRPDLEFIWTRPAILAWHYSQNTLVERNVLIDCDKGIYFGKESQGKLSHTGGIIRNNFIKGYDHTQAGIGLIYAKGAKVINNTIYCPGGSSSYSIEARHQETDSCLIMNNLSDEPILPDDDGASCKLENNITHATASYFVDITKGNLHLATDTIDAINGGIVTEERNTDIDCDSVKDQQPDVGADEYQRLLSISFEITDGKDELEGVIVSLGSLKDTTGQDGMVIFTGLEPGTKWQYKINKESFSTASGYVEFFDHMDLKIELTPFYSVTFTVYGAGDIAIDQALVNLDTSELETDIEGKAIFHNILRQDSLFYKVSKVGFLPDSGFIKIDSNLLKKINLIELFSVEFQVTSNFIPVNGAIILFNGLKDTTGIDGKVKFNDIPADSMVLFKITQEGYYADSGYVNVNDNILKSIELTATSLNDIGEPSNLFYPNPVRDILHFQNTVEEIEMINTNGLLVMKIKNKSRVNVKNFDPGTYLIRFKEKGEWSEYRKIIIE